MKKTYTIRAKNLRQAKSIQRIVGPNLKNLEPIFVIDPELKEPVLETQMQRIEREHEILSHFGSFVH